ncbi:SocA family protein [Salegentibacter sp. BDJ18]|uniref:type II toxin-antitoxin system antitoxin SocA domain-containing protein n=1 Tax=Salegentibacter sp. BDJ18 TaxID=2816376 RepID=UPI001AAEE10C|nr:SocA family protein [Salegentibacter sp. BDJ18]
MEKTSYIRLSSTQIDKVGNAIIYLSNKIPNLSKTKALKLIYILDELSIKKSGIPYFNLKYKVWKFGPVSEEIFIDLSSETTLLKKYIERSSEEGTTVINPISEFNDDEFSDNDIDLLDFVIEEFGNKTAKNLVFYTHRKNSPWHNTALENSVLELLESEEINNTELLIDMGSLVNHDERKKMIYNEFQESH